MNKLYIALLLVLSSFISLSQTQIPNFTLVDTQGNTYNLYEELEQGKSIVLDFFSLQCGTCQTGIAYMENIWQTDGANGDNVWVWAIESLGGSNVDIEDFIYSNGGSFPGFNLLENDTLSSFFNITYTPIYFIICPDKTIKSAPVESAFNYVESCQTTNSILDNYNQYNNEIISIRTESEIIIDFNLSSNSTVIFEVYDLLGNKIMQSITRETRGKSRSTFSKWNMTNGYYFTRMIVDNYFIEAERFILR